MQTSDTQQSGPGPKGWQAKKYGKLTGDWREMLRLGFAECFRVLRAEGTLIFKWNEHEIPVSEILALTPEKPLVGQRCGKTAKTHWLVFLKGGGGAEQAGDGSDGPVSPLFRATGGRESAWDRYLWLVEFKAWADQRNYGLPARNNEDQVRSESGAPQP